MEYIGVRFGEMHSWIDYRLRPVAFHTPEPEMRREEITVPGRHGKVDLSRALTGYMIYENRELEYIFDFRAETIEKYSAKIDQIRSDLHGEELEIIEDADQEYYYLGTVRVVSEYNAEEIDHEVSILVDAYPFKRKRSATKLTHTVSGEKKIVCRNEKMETVPRFVADSGFRIEFGNNSYSIVAGTSIIPDLIFSQGANTLKLFGTGTLTIQYQEGKV